MTLNDFEQGQKTTKFYLTDSLLCFVFVTPNGSTDMPQNTYTHATTRATHCCIS